jgi:phage recombination protein Bet
VTENAAPLARQNDGKRELSYETVSSMTGYSLEQIALIVRTVAKDTPTVELAAFLHACNKLHLDPILKQAYWIRRRNREKDAKGNWQDVMRGSLQVGIDGYRAIADRQGNYAGSEPPSFSDWQELTDEKSGEVIRVPGLARVLVWKIVGAHKAAFHGEAAWREFYPGPGGVGERWRKMPRHMLAKVAEAQALRKGWPAVLGAVELDDDDTPDGEILIEAPRTQVLEDQRAREAAVYERVYGQEDDNMGGLSSPRAARRRREQPDPEPDPDDEPRPGPDDAGDDDDDAADEPQPARSRQQKAEVTF